MENKMNKTHSKFTLGEKYGDVDLSLCDTVDSFFWDVSHPIINYGRTILSPSFNLNNKGGQITWSI